MCKTAAILSVPPVVSRKQMLVLTWLSPQTRVDLPLAEEDTASLIDYTLGCFVLHFIIAISYLSVLLRLCLSHGDVTKWKHFPRYWPFVRGIHRSPVNWPHKGQWRRAFMFSLICASVNAWVNNLKTGDLRRHRAHYNVSVMKSRVALLLLQ